MMTELLNKKCEPCEGKTKAFTRQEASAYSSDVSGWKLTEDARGIYRELILKDFMAAVTLINQIAAIAEQENHHPDIHLVSYCRRHCIVYYFSYAVIIDYYTIYLDSETVSCKN